MSYKEPVDGDQVEDGTITNADINAAAAIQHSKMESDARARANHTGTQLAATISDFSTAARAESTAGAGLTRTGASLDVIAGAGIVVGANDVAIDTAVVARLTASGTFLNDMTFSAAIISGAGIRLKTSNAAGPTTFVVNPATHNIILCDLSGGAIDVELPANHSAGDQVTAKDISGDAATNNLTFTTADADTIDGDPTAVVAIDYGALTVCSNGINWFIIHSHLP